MPRSRRATFAALTGALAAGRLDLSAGGDWAEARRRLAALPGIGPWTVETIAMRALGDPDAFPATDLGVRLAARELGLPATPGRADRARRRLAAVAGLRGAVPVGHRRPRHQRPARPPAGQEDQP